MPKESGDPIQTPEAIARNLRTLRNAIKYAYSGSAEHGSFRRGGGGEFVPSVFMVLDELDREVCALAERAAQAEEWADLVTRGKSPCGHWKAYSHTEDGGKRINCWRCQAEAAEALAERAAQLEAQNDEGEDMNEIPRRCRIDLMVPAELAIHAAIDAVEALPADVRLTNAVVLLGQARDRVADYVDAVTGASGAIPPQHIVDLAVQVSGWSPCRSKRGVVIFAGEDVVTHGYNYKPRGFDCDQTDACKATCRHEAIHAEQQALLLAGRKAEGADMLHVKTVNGKLVASGGPSCVECSKLALVAGIAGVWLYHEDGWRRYDILEFHRLSLLSICALAERAAQLEHNARSICVWCGTITPFPHGYDSTPEERVRIMWEHAEGCDKRPEKRLAAALEAAEAHVAQLQQRVTELAARLSEVLSLFDDPCPYDAATTRAAARAALAGTPSPSRQIVLPDVPKGIRMLKLLRHEDANAATYNEAIECAANYVERVWCQPGRGANAPSESTLAALAGTPAPPSDRAEPVAVLLPAIPGHQHIIRDGRPVCGCKFPVEHVTPARPRRPQRSSHDAAGPPSESDEAAQRD